MTPFDRCRRAASVVLVVACLLLVPAMATAKFTAGRSPTLSVSTDSMEPLTGLAGSFACTNTPQAGTESVAISVAGFTDAGPAGSTYAYRLLLGASLRDSTTSTTHTGTLTTTQPSDKNPTTWTVTVQATLGGWTGPVITRSVTCTRKSDNSGTL